MSQINLIDLICEKVKNLKAYQVETVKEGIKLHANENPYSPSPELTKRILERLESLDLNRYPDPDCKNFFAISRPKPCAPPVIIAVLFLRSN